MKKVIYLAFAGLLFTGCSEKSSINPIAEESDKQMITLQSINEMGELDASFSFPVDQLVANPTTSTSTKSNSPTIQTSGPIMNGHFNTAGGTSMTFSGAINNGGVHGNANLNGGLNFKFATACIELDDNQGVISGEITQITSLPNGLDTILFVGDYVYFLLIDNGQGANASPDQYSGQFYYSPAAFGPLCDQITPQSGAWNPALILDVANQGDQIQIH